VDIDVLEDVDAGPLILEERDDSVSVRGLNGQRDTGRLAIVERAQGAVDNQPLAQLRRKALLRNRTAAENGSPTRIPGPLAGAAPPASHCSVAMLKA
jgi:hypothetical protein